MEIKQEAKNVCFDLKKDIRKVNQLENQIFQRTAKFIMAIFYEMDFMKGIAILVK